MRKLMKRSWTWLLATTLSFTSILAANATTDSYVDDDWTAASCGGHVWGVNAFAKIQDAVDAADVSTGAVTICVAAGTYNETVVMNGKSNLIYDNSTKIGRLHFIAEAGKTVTVNGAFTFGNDSVQQQDICDVEISGFTFTNGNSIPIYIMNSSTASKDIVIKNNTVTFSSATYSAGVLYVNSKDVDGLTVTGNTVTGNTGYSGSFGGPGGTINNAVISGNTFCSFFAVFGKVLEDGAEISGNISTGASGTGQNIWINNNKEKSVGTITLAGNAFSSVYKSAFAFNTAYDGKSAFSIGAGNTFGGESITGWADAANVYVHENATEGRAMYYNHLLYLGDETAFTTLAAATAAYGESTNEIAIANYNAQMEAPEGWGFKTEGGVTKLVKLAAKIGETGYETLQAAFDAVKEGETIVVLKDNTETITVTNTCSFTVNANNHTLGAAPTVPAGYRFTVNGDGTCTYAAIPPTIATMSCNGVSVGSYDTIAGAFDAFAQLENTGDEGDYLIEIKGGTYALPKCTVRQWVGKSLTVQPMKTGETFDKVTLKFADSNQEAIFYIHGKWTYDTAPTTFNKIDFEWTGDVSAEEPSFVRFGANASTDNKVSDVTFSGCNFVGGSSKKLYAVNGYPNGDKAWPKNIKFVGSTFTNLLYVFYAPSSSEISINDPFVTFNGCTVADCIYLCYVARGNCLLIIDNCNVSICDGSSNNGYAVNVGSTDNDVDGLIRVSNSEFSYSGTQYTYAYLRGRSNKSNCSITVDVDNYTAQHCAAVSGLHLGDVANRTNGGKTIVKIDGKEQAQLTGENNYYTFPSPVAKVDETPYVLLSSAFEAVTNGQTITVLRDNSEDLSGVTIASDVTGFTVNSQGFNMGSNPPTAATGYEFVKAGDVCSYGPNKVAQIGETPYATLAAAVAEAKAGDTITMLKTVAEDLTVKAPNADFAIDLGTYGIGKVFVGFETGTDASEKLTLTGAACSMDAAAYVGQADSDDAKGVAGWEDRKYELNIVGSEKGDTAVTADQFYVRTTGTLNITNATVSYKYVNLYGAINLTDASFVGKGANFYILGRESKKAKDKAIVTLNNSTLDHSIYELRLGSMEGDTMGSGLVVLKNNSILKAQDIILAPNAGGSFGTIAVVSTNSAIQVTKGLTIGAGDFITLVGSTVTLKSITNNGAINIDATGITAPVKVIDYTGTDAMTLDSYGTVNVTGGEAYVEDNDLWVKLPPVCRIGTKGYDSLAAAMVDARAATTPEGKTITILGEVNGFNFNGDSTGITLVGAEGHKITSNFMADGPYTSTLKDATFKNLNFVECGILFSYSINDVRGLTIEGCTFTYTGSTEGIHGIQYQKSATCLIDGLTITNNVITGFTGSGIILNGSAPSDNGKVVIVDNDISNVGANAIQALSIDGLTIAGNTMSGSSAWTVNNLSGSKNITFLNNDVTKTLSANGRTLFGYIADVVTMGDTETTHSTVTLPDSTVLTKAVDIIQQDLTSKNASYAYNEGAVIYTDRTLFDEQTGKVIGGSIFGTVALINSKVAEAYQIPFLSGLTTAMVFYTDVANRQIELAGSNVGAITISSDFGVNLDGCAYDGTITAEEDSTLTVETDTTFAAGSKIYLPYEKDSDEFKAWVAANITAEQAENVTVYGCTFVAQIGDKKYTSLQKAVKAAQEGDTITMIADCDLTEQLTVGKSVKIDLNDKTVTSKVAGARAIVVNGKANLEVVGGDLAIAVDGNNTLGLFDLTAAGSLVMKDVTMSGDTSDVGGAKSALIFCDGEGVNVTLTDCNANTNLRVYRNNRSGGTLCVSGGTYNSKGQNVVFLDSGVATYENVTVNVEGTDAAYQCAFYVNGGYALVKDCTASSPKGNKGVLDVCMHGVMDVVGGTYTGAYGAYVQTSGGIINIKGGTVTGTTKALFAHTEKQYQVTESRITVSGDAAINGDMQVSSANTFIILAGGSYDREPDLQEGTYQAIKLADGCVLFKTGDRWTVGVKIDPGSGEKTVPAIEQASDSTVNETAVDKVVTDEEVADKMKTETSVLGVKLTTESPSEGVASGMQAVVDLAKQDAEIKAALETASMVTVKVDVVVSPVKYTPPVAEATVGSVSFNLTPIATVTVISTNGTVTTTKSKNVDVSNTMIDTNQNIVVSLYTGFKPALLVHKDDNGKLIETFSEKDFLFADGTCTLTIHHFSEVDAEQDPSYVAMIGDTKYTSLQDAFDMVSDNTQTTVALLKDIELTETATLAANKAATLDLSGRTITWKSTVSEKSNGLVSSEGELDLVNGTLDAGDGNVFATCASDGIVNIVSGTYDGAFPDATGIATNAGPIFVSGGRFSSKIPAAFCAVGYLPNDTPSAVDGRYTVKDAETFIRNICAKQRYPWNGYVDITFEMRMNAVKDKPVRVFVAAYDSAGARIAGLEEVAWLKDDGSKPTVNVKDGSFKVAAPALTKVHLLWNSAIVFPDQKVEGITFKVFAK